MANGGPHAAYGSLLLPSSLSGDQTKQLRDALCSAFPSRAALGQMVRFRLNKNLEALVSGGNLATAAFELVQAAEAGGWLGDLVQGASAENPGNPALRAFIAQFGPSAGAAPPAAQAPRGRRLTGEQIDALYAAAIDGNLTGARTTLFSAIDPRFTAGLPVLSSPAEQLLSDLHQLNRVGQLRDGSDPLVLWLKAALNILGVRPESAVVQDMLAAL